MKYFSGTATHTRSIRAEAAWFAPGAHQWLDLGDVQNLAEVAVNSTPLGIVWKKPFRGDMTGAVKTGRQCARGQGHEPLGESDDRRSAAGCAEQFTFTRPVFYKADSPLLPSGLLGPVRVLQVMAAEPRPTGSRVP